MVAPKRAKAKQNMDEVLQEFLAMEQDVGSVHRVEQRLELRLCGTTAYVPTYTKHVMDENHGAPVVAIQTKTSVTTKRVFLYPTDQLKAAGTKKLRVDETMGPAHFGFGVPLKTLGLKFPASRQIILPLTAIEAPGHGTIYWASFADLESQRRDIKPADKAAPNE